MGYQDGFGQKLVKVMQKKCSLFSGYGVYYC